MSPACRTPFISPILPWTSQSSGRGCQTRTGIATEKTQAQPQGEMPCQLRRAMQVATLPSHTLISRGGSKWQHFLFLETAHPPIPPPPSLHRGTSCPDTVFASYQCQSLPTVLWGLKVLTSVMPKRGLVRCSSELQFLSLTPFPRPRRHFGWHFFRAVPMNLLSRESRKTPFNLCLSRQSLNLFICVCAYPWVNASSGFNVCFLPKTKVAVLFF